MKTKEMNGRHYIDAKVVIIDSEEVTFLFKKSNGELEYNHKPPFYGVNELGWKYQDIYILSDEKPIKGEYVYDYAHDKIGIFDSLVVDGGNFSDHAKKIIASTKKLETKDELLSAHENKYVPKFARQITKEFFEEFVEAYNSGNKITDVLVEVENVNSGWQSLANSGKAGSTYVPEKFDLKIYNTNFINIKSKQNEWNEIWDKFHLEYKSKSTNVSLNFFNWLKFAKTL